MKNLYIIIPVLNEAAHLKEHIQTIWKNAQFSTVNTILFLINDGSTDQTESVLKQLNAENPNIHHMQFLRNFGKEAAILAGLKIAHEDLQMAACVVMDSDLQHPPSLLPQMFEQWQNGALLIEAHKKQRPAESFFYRQSAKLFYGLFNQLTGTQHFEKQTDFKWMDKSVVEKYLTFPEHRKFFRGIMAWMNIPSVSLPFDVPHRQNESSRWRFHALIRYALVNLQSFSNAPLQLVSACGVMAFLVGFFFAAFALFQKLNGIAVEGFTTVIVLLSFFASIIMFALGVIGFYLSAIYDELKKRPPYIWADHNKG